MTNPKKPIPVKEDGVELLKEIARQAQNITGFVFHGSHQIYTKLDPQPVYWKDPKGLLYPDRRTGCMCE